MIILPLKIGMFGRMNLPEPLNPRFKEYTEQKISLNKFMNHLGLKFSSIQPGYIEGYLDFMEMHQQQNGWLHGGVTSALLDTLQGFAAYTLVAEGQQVFTVEAKVSYFRPGIGHKFFIRGGVVKPGSRFHFCEAEVYYLSDSNEEVVVARGSATMAIV